MDKHIFSITPGVYWHGRWPKNRIEQNRKLYDFELVWFSGGRGRVIVGKEVYTFYPGSVIIIPPGVVHCTFADTAVERWCIHFDWYGDCVFHADPAESGSYFVYDDPGNDGFDESIAAASPDIAGVCFPRFCRTVPAEIFRYIQGFFSEIKSNKLAATGYLMLALSGVLAAETHRSSAASLLLKAKSRIDSDFSDPLLSAGSVAADFNITVNHLNRLFKTAFGVSTTEYIQSRRLEHAESMLTGTGMAIKEIAFASGFNDHNYFSRLFKARKNITPGELRN